MRGRNDKENKMARFNNIDQFRVFVINEILRLQEQISWIALCTKYQLNKWETYDLTRHHRYLLDTIENAKLSEAGK